VMRVIVAQRAGVELEHAEMTVAVFARRNDTRYVDTSRTVRHTFDTSFGTCDIDDVINIEQLRDSTSLYVIDGSLCVRVFVRPLSFHNSLSQT